MRWFSVSTLKKSQSTLQYTMAIALVASTLIVMYQYVGRGLQGRLKDSVDTLGKDFNNATLFEMGEEFNGTSKSSDNRTNFGFAWESKKGHMVDVRIGSVHSYSKLTVPPHNPTTNCDVSQPGCKAALKQQDAVGASSLEPLQPTTAQEYKLDELVEARKSGKGFEEGNQAKMDNGGSAQALESGDYRSYELPLYNADNVDVNKVQADMERKLGE